MVEYIKTLSQLEAEIKEREKNSEEIEKRIKVYWKKRGIDWDMILTALKPVGSRVECVLGKNIPTVNLEDLTMPVLTDRITLNTSIEMKPRWWSFVADHYSVDNRLKQALVNLPVITGSGDIEDFEIADEKSLEGMPLCRIKVVGGYLPDFHMQMRAKIFPSAIAGNTDDISKVFSLALAGALENGSNNELSRISSVYMENGEDGRSVRFSIEKDKKFHDANGNCLTIRELADFAHEGLVRPSARWYYLVYLSFFMSGDRVLFETFEDARDFLPVVDSAARRLKNETGCSPIIVETPASVGDIPTEAYPYWVLNGCDNKWPKIPRDESGVKQDCVSDKFSEIAQYILNL